MSDETTQWQRRREVKFGLKDLIYIISTVITFTVSYTSMENRVEYLEKENVKNAAIIASLSSIDKRLALIEWRLDNPLAKFKPNE